MDELINLYMKTMYDVEHPSEKMKFAARTEIQKATEYENIHPDIVKGILLKVQEVPFQKRYSDFIARKNKFNSLNLINYKSEYFHPYLFKVNQPKRYFNDEDILVTEEYTMKKETVKAVSIKMILSYISFNFPNIYIDQKKDESLIRHILFSAIPNKLIHINNKITTEEIKEKALDVLFFTIDACALTFNDRGETLKNLITLTDFIDDGINMRESKINCIKEDLYERAKQKWED